MAKRAKPKQPAPIVEGHKTLSTGRRRQLEYDLLRELSHRIPQKFLRECTGRQPKQIKDQAERYQLAFSGRIWDLEKLLRSVFDLLARIGPHYSRWMRIRGGAKDTGESQTAIERWQEARAERAEFELARIRTEFIPREDVHEGLAVFSGVLRDAGDRLQRQCGPVAHEIFQEALDGAEKAVRRVLKDETHGEAKI